MMRPSSARDDTPDRRAQVERMALAVAFEANAVAELGEDGAARTERVRVAVRALEREANAIAPALDTDDRVLAFVRLVLRLVPDELAGR